MMRKSWFCAAAVLTVCAVFSGNAPASAETLAGFGADISGAYPETDGGEEEIPESIPESITESITENITEDMTEDMDEGPKMV